MVIYYKQLPAALSLGVLAGFTATVHASTVELLALGDSITLGSDSDTSGDPFPGSVDNDLGGYRFYLDRSLGNLDSLAYPDFDFVGSRTRGDGITDAPAQPFTDNQHFGVSAARASQEVFFGGSDYRPSMLTGIDNVDYLDNLNKRDGLNQPLTDPTHAAFDPTQNQPNAVLLQIGINSLAPRRASDLKNGSDIQDRLDNSVTSAFNEFVTLLDGDNGEDREDGNDGPRVGLVNRLTNNTLDGDLTNDNTYFADDAHLFVAQIIPQTQAINGGGDNDDGYLYARQPHLVADYNKQVKDELLSRMGPGGDLEGRVTFVDMFSISLAELDLTALADEFFAGVTPEDTAQDRMDALLLAINPETEGGTDETDYVDWIQGGPGFAFDEGDFDEGTFDYSEYAGGNLVDPTGGNDNNKLLNDNLHPTNLGYAITAQVWANALEAHYAVPEPSALSLLALGGLIIAGRRRRRA